MNEQFNFERRYGSTLATVFTCFTYGLAIPTLWFTAAEVFLIQFIADKVLMSYYFKEKVIYNDTLNRFVMGIAKYAICFFLYFGGVQISMNHCTISNND